MAAKLAFPDRPAILLSGDGAIHFAISDLESATRQHIPFVVVVADDSAWGIVVTEQRRAYGTDSTIASSIGPVRYDLVAQGLGANGSRAETADALKVEMKKALGADRPSLIQVSIAIAGPHE
jgi:acetolactate synthase-1/2/3 large subunit